MKRDHLGAGVRVLAAVDGGDARARFAQRAAQVRADEAGAAGDEKVTVGNGEAHGGSLPDRAPGRERHVGVLPVARPREAPCYSPHT